MNRDLSDVPSTLSDMANNEAAPERPAPIPTQGDDAAGMRGGFIQDVATNVISDPISVALGVGAKTAWDALKQGGGGKGGEGGGPDQE